MSAIFSVYLDSDPVTGSVQLPMGLALAYVTLTGGDTVSSAKWQARLPSGTLLTDGGSFEATHVVSTDLYVFFQYRWLWTFPPDAAFCANDEVQFRAHAVLTSTAVLDTAWTSNKVYSGSDGGGLTPLDRDILQKILDSVRKVY